MTLTLWIDADAAPQAVKEICLGERLSVRNFMDALRTSGVETGGHSAYSPRDKQAFANALDRALTRARRKG